MAIFCWICISLCAIFSGNCQETTNYWTNKAGELYSAGEFTDAAIAYERAIFIGTTGSESSLLKLKKADCYKQLGNFPRALKELETIFLPAIPDSIQTKVIYQKALCQYLNHNPQEADAWIQQLPPDYCPSEALVLEILTCTDLLQPEKAREHMLLLIKKNSSGLLQDSLIIACNQIFIKYSSLKLKKAKTAALLSSFFPGAGQIYTGNVGRSMLALTFTAGSIGLAAFEILNGFYLTGYVTGLGFFQKFYFGGIEQSRRLAEERNSKKMAKYKGKVKTLVFSIANR